jgi:hypothetical protein
LVHPSSAFLKSELEECNRCPIYKQMIALPALLSQVAKAKWNVKEFRDSPLLPKWEPELISNISMRLNVDLEKLLK